MRIVVPIAGNEVAAALEACESVRLFEDDHGRIVRRTELPLTGTALETLERSGADVVVCGALTAEERKTLAASGLLLAADASGDAEEAVRACLSRTVACDPGNTCNYCGHKDECELPKRKETP